VGFDFYHVGLINSEMLTAGRRGTAAEYPALADYLPILKTPVMNSNAPKMNGNAREMPATSGQRIELSIRAR
jgi:hypothetical protein